MAIEFYKEFGENGYLANYSNYGFYKNNVFYKTVEHYYQSEKFNDEKIKKRIIDAESPKEASKIGRDRNNKRKDNFRTIKKRVMLDGVLEKFRQNKNILYKLIETREKELIEKTEDEYYWGIGKDNSGLNNFGKILMQARTILKNEVLEKIIKNCEGNEIYILGHPFPDADSIFSSYLLNKVFNNKGIKSHFCVLKENYKYSENDKEIILKYLVEQPEVLDKIEDKKIFFVDHNNLNGIPRENVLGAIDHHIISGEVENVLEMEYSSTGLLIYDLFKNDYSFSSYEKFIVGLTVLTDTDYLCSSRFTDEDKIIYSSLGVEIDEEEMKRNFFRTTSLNGKINDIIKKNMKKYDIEEKKINRVLISSYSTDYEHYFRKFCVHLNKNSGNWLLIWCDYEKKNTFVYYKNNLLKLDYITTSTYIVLGILKGNHLL